MGAVSQGFSPRLRRLRLLAAIVLILLVATFLRFHNLGGQSFWNDEGNSARLSERSIQLIIEGTASDIHPPLYYLLLRGWRELVGESEFGLRSLSAFAGVVVVAGTAALGRATFFYGKGEGANSGKRVVWTAVLLAALITAVSPPLVYYSQEARMYSLLALTATLSTVFLFWWWRTIRHKTKSSNRSKMVLLAAGYVLFAAAGLYTQYAFPAVIVAQNCMMLILIARDRRLAVRDARVSPLKAHISRLKRPVLVWLAMMLAVFLLYLPWLPVFLGNIGGGPAERPFLPDYLLNVFRWLAFGHTLEVDAAAAPLTAVFILMGVGIFLERGWRTAVWLTALFVPILTAHYVGAVEPRLFKILLPAIAPFALVNVLVVFASFQDQRDVQKQTAGISLVYGKWRLQFLGLSAILGALAILGITQSLVNLYTNPAYARADYRGLAARIAADDHPNAGIILNAPNQWEVFTYYHTAGAPVYPLPLSGMSRDQIQAELADIAARHDRLYVIYWGDSQQDPERIVERWLDENSFKATEMWEKDVRFVVYAVPSAPAAAMKTPVNAPFGDHITLTGYTLANRNLTPGDILQIALFWQTDASLNGRYKVFLHLLDENGQLVAQRDSEPGGSLKPTNSWQPGERISDNHGILIPPDLPPGRYNLSLGLYDIADPSARLPIYTESGSQDALSIETISVSN